jgi:hypothetical protein
MLGIAGIGLVFAYLAFAWIVDRRNSVRVAPGLRLPVTRAGERPLPLNQRHFLDRWIFTTAGVGLLGALSLVVILWRTLF